MDSQSVPQDRETHDRQDLSDHTVSEPDLILDALTSKNPASPSAQPTIQSPPTRPADQQPSNQLQFQLVASISCNFPPRLPPASESSPKPVKSLDTTICKPIRDQSLPKPKPPSDDQPHETPANPVLPTSKSTQDESPKVMSPKPVHTALPPSNEALAEASPNPVRPNAPSLPIEPVEEAGPNHAGDISTSPKDVLQDPPQSDIPPKTPQPSASPPSEQSPQQSPRSPEVIDDEDIQFFAADIDDRRDDNQGESAADDQDVIKLAGSPESLQTNVRQPTPVSSSQLTTQPQSSDSTERKEAPKQSRSLSTDQHSERDSELLQPKMQSERKPSPERKQCPNPTPQMNTEADDTLEKSELQVLDSPGQSEALQNISDAHSDKTPAPNVHDSNKSDCQLVVRTDNSSRVENDTAQQLIQTNAKQETGSESFIAAGDEGNKTLDSPSDSKLLQSSGSAIEMKDSELVKTSTQREAGGQINAEVECEQNQNSRETKGAFDDLGNSRKQSGVLMAISTDKVGNRVEDTTPETPEGKQQIEATMEGNNASNVSKAQNILLDGTPPVSPVKPLPPRRTAEVRNVDELDLRHHKQIQEQLDEAIVVKRAPSPKRMNEEKHISDENSGQGNRESPVSPRRNFSPQSLPDRPDSPIGAHSSHGKHDPANQVPEDEGYMSGSPQSPVFNPEYTVDEALPPIPSSYQDGPPSPELSPANISPAIASPEPEKPHLYGSDIPEAVEPAPDRVGHRDRDDPASYAIKTFEEADPSSYLDHEGEELVPANADSPQVGAPAVDIADLSPILKHSLARLPLQNIVVSVPHFILYAPPCADDIAIVRAMEDMLEAEKLRRSKDTFALSKPPKSILIITKDPQRAYAWSDLLNDCSSLSHTTHGIHDGQPGNAKVERYRRNDSAALDGIFGVKNVIITLSHTALREASRRYLHLRKICLLVFDTADYVVSRAHPSSVLMRDYYLALPPLHRPRVLAISSRILRDTQKPPIERNLVSPFVSESAENDACWKSCYGSGSRAADSAIDLEYISYSPSLFGEYEATSGLKADDRPSTELEHLMGEVGPLGVALYQQRRKNRRLENNTEFHRSYDAMGSLYRFGEKACLRGLTPKCLSLLNELERGYAASTAKDQFSVVIYAGRPTVAAALREVISTLPVFEAVTTRIVIGGEGAKSFESYDKEDDGERKRWQGYDTDDDSVAIFQAGEANILIVARPSSEVGKWIRPIPNCPLIIQYDESEPDTMAEIENGRCRVIAFRKRKKRHSRGSGRRAENENLENNAAPPEEPRAPSNGELRNPEQPRYTDTKAVSSELQVKKSESEGEGYPVITLEVTSNRRPKQKSRISDDEQDVDSVYYCKPPAYLIGPSKTGSDSCFMYRMFLYGSNPQRSSSGKNGSAIFIGIEDFLLVLSRKIEDEDEVMSFQDMFPSRTAISTFLKLEYQGCTSLNEKQIQEARQYNAALFSLTFPSLTPERFLWEDVPSAAEEDSTNIDIEAERATGHQFLRKYLLLPAKKNESSDEHSEQNPTGTESKLLEPIQTYFSSKRRIPEGRLPGQICEIDWEAVRAVLDFQDPDIFMKQARTISPVEPNQFHEHEASFVFSTYPGEKAMVCGQLKHDYSPLSSQQRCKKFELTEDGMFVPNDELSNLTELYVKEELLNVKAFTRSRNDQSDGAEEKSARRNSAAKAKKEKENIERSNVTSKIIPARWCKESSCIVSDKNVIGWKRKRAAISKPKKASFDPTRNILKQRKHWVGRVAYTLEHNWNMYNTKDLKYLDQPLLFAACARHCGVQELMGVADGSSLQEICDKLVSKSDDTRMLAPEVCRRFPMSIGAVFLPAVLSGVERHLSICEMRQDLDPTVEIQSDTKMLMQAVTAAHVNSSANYERLELLGDSVLKLSCTLRLFTFGPHDKEGEMHRIRAYKVCNARLHRLAHKKGLHNYIRFRQESLNDWKPPGTDTRGREQKVSLKGLADVAEAICGAYFLCGSNSKGVEAYKSNPPSWTSDERVEMDSESSSLDCETSVGKKRRVKKQGSSGKRKRRGIVHSGVKNNPMSVENVLRGYAAGCKFLEDLKVFEEAEPTHREVLLSAIHAMHPAGSPAPTEISLDAFPYDARLSHPEKCWEEQFGVLENIIGYQFKRRPLLICALTHGSYVKANGSCTAEEQTFQRLEFLGDAAADFFVVRYLYDKYPGLGPGEITTLKGNVVSNESFARVTVKHGIHKFLFHSSTAYTSEIACFVENVEAESGGIGTKKGELGELAAPKVLGDVFEAIVGAVLVDSGLQEVWKVCTKLLTESLEENADPMRDEMHPATLLQDLVMRVWKISSSAPHYKFEKKAGERGQSRTEATVVILGEKIASGRGSTSKRARLQAAMAALRLLRDPDSNSHGAQLLTRLRAEGVRRMVAAQRGVCVNDSHVGK